MTMRVLYVAQAFWPEIGGCQVRTSALLPGLQELGYEFAVLTSAQEPGLLDQGEYKGIPVHRLPFRQALALGDVDLLVDLLSRAAEVKRAFRPDLVHVDFTDAVVFFHLRTVRAHPVPWVLALHLSIPALESGRRDTLIGRALRSANWVTACSAAGLGDAHRLVPETIDRSSVIYCGLPMPDVSPKPLPTAPPHLLCLGRVVTDKGFDLALQAFGRLLDRFPEATLTIAGDGTARPALEQQAEALGIARAVRFAGWVAPQQVPELINQASVVVIPSRWTEEGLPLVAVEAAQMARPVVATSVGGMGEAVVHGQTGLLVERENSEALAEAVGYLLASPAVATAMGQAARHRAQEMFALKRYVETYDALYRRIVDEQPGSKPSQSPYAAASQHRAGRGNPL